MATGAAALLITVLLGATVVLGWLAFYTIYPVWKRFLTLPPIKKLRLYPQSQVMVEIQKMVDNAKVDIKPKYVWSYFLWNYCNESIRQRVKNLADFAHSLYLVSFGFIILPLLYIVIRILEGSNATLSRLLNLVADYNLPLALAYESILIFLSILLGAYILEKGKDRIQYAEQIQWLLYKEQKDKLMNIIQKIGITPSNQSKELD